MKSIPISSVMTKNVVCVKPDQNIIDVKHIYEKKKISPSYTSDRKR